MRYDKRNNFLDIAIPADGKVTARVIGSRISIRVTDPAAVLGRSMCRAV